MNKFIFDVDGTLTPSRQEIDGDFAVFFGNFCAEHDVYLVTGSDKEKTIEQIGEEIYIALLNVFITVQVVMFGKVKHTFVQITGKFLCMLNHGYKIN